MVSGKRRKRLVDVVVGTVLALVAIPLVITFAVAVAASLRAWPFFVQRRVGQHGGTIRVPKLRTLPPSTPRYALKTQCTIAPTTRVCAFLRRTHLDELPQLLLVPLGRLSLVGPRPRMPDDVEPVEEHYRATRETVPQGCTGLWQISSEREGLPCEAPEYDVFYVLHSSVRFDLWILWRTVLHMTSLRPGVALHDVPRWAVGDGRPAGAAAVGGARRRVTTTTMAGATAAAGVAASVGAAMLSTPNHVP